MLPSPTDGFAASFSKRCCGETSQRGQSSDGGGTRVGDPGNLTSVSARQNSSSRLERVALPKLTLVESPSIADSRPAATAAAAAANGEVPEPVPWHPEASPAVISETTPEEATDSTWLARTTDRANSLRQLFDLPSTEV